MAEQLATTNGHSTAISILESTTHIPIAQLTPLLAVPDSRSLKAIVTLTWPYSSATGSVAFLLAEPDFRLRRTRGQVRVQFSGSSGKVIAKSGIGSGDEVVLCLDGVEWLESDAAITTPGRGVEFELKFTERLLLQFRPEGSQNVEIININHPDPEPIPTTAPPPPLETTTEIETAEVATAPSPLSRKLPVQDAEEYSSPAFMKRARTSYGSLFEGEYDPFEQEDGSVRGKGRKRTRLSTAWRFESRSPSPSPSPSPEIEESEAAPSESHIPEPVTPAAPIMTDEGVQTMEVENQSEELGITSEEKQKAASITGEVDPRDIPQVVQSLSQAKSPIQEPTEISMPPPEIRTDTIVFETTLGTDPNGVPPGDLDAKLPLSPELRPQPSENLPLVSPFVTTPLESYQNHIDNDRTLEDPTWHDKSAIPVQYNPRIPFEGTTREDLYTASPPRRTSNPDLRNSEDSIALLDDTNFFSNTKPSLHSHFEDQPNVGTVQNELGQSPVYNLAEVEKEQSHSGDDRSEISTHPDQYDMEGVESSYKYPDPDQTRYQSNNWEAQPRMIYPDLEDNHDSTSQSPYPISSHKDRSQSIQSQVVDLTESDEDVDEDAEGFSEDGLADDREQYHPNPHYQSEEAIYDDDEEAVYDNDDEENGEFDDEFGAKRSKMSPIYDQDADSYDYDENDENMDPENISTYNSEDAEDIEEQDEESYDEDETEDEAPPSQRQPQRQPQREPEIIDLLSSDEEDVNEQDVDEQSESAAPKEDVNEQDVDEQSEPAAPVATKIRFKSLEIPRDQAVEDEEDNDKDDEDDDEDNEDDDNEDDEDAYDTPAHVSESQEAFQESSSDLVEEAYVQEDDGNVVEEEAAIVQASSPDTDADEEMSEIQQHSSDISLQTQSDEHAEKNNAESEGAERTDDSSAESLSVPEQMDTDNGTDNLDNLIEKLESSESEVLLGAKDSSIDVIKFTEETKYTEAEDSVQPRSTNDENFDEDSLQTQPSANVHIDTVNRTAIESPAKVDQASKSGWNQSSSKEGLFSKMFSLDGANDDDEEQSDTHKENSDVSYPTLPTNILEDQQPVNQSEDSNNDISETRPGNQQLPTPAETQKTIVSEVSSLSVSDQLQEQLQEELGDIDEESEPTQVHLDVEMNSETRVEETPVDDNAVDPECMDVDQVHPLETPAVDSDIEISKAEIVEMKQTESEQVEIEQVESEPIVPSNGHDEIENDGVGSKQVQIKETETTQVETEQTENGDQVPVTVTINVEEIDIEESSTVVEEQMSEDEPNIETTSQKHVDNDAPTSQESQEKRQQRATSETKKGKKEDIIPSPRQTRSKKIEPVVEIVAPITPSQYDKENVKLSSRTTARSKKSPSAVLHEQETPQGHDASAEMALESLESPTKAGHNLRSAPVTDPKIRLTRYLRTDLSEFTTLKMLRFKMKSKIDILAIATSTPAEPQRASRGPRDYLSTFTITDQTIAPANVIEVQILRPYKDALPTPKVGDGVLLRDFSVVSVKGKGFALRSEEGSSWAVFKDEGVEIEVKGPPVEYGVAEKKHVKELREWFHGLDDESKSKVEKVSTALEMVSPGKGKTQDKEKK